MTFTVNGLDLTPYIADLKWVSNDLHDESSGRTMDGTMHVYRIGTKEQVEVSLIPLNQTTAAQILDALRSDAEFPVSYTSPDLGERSDVTCYCSARNCEFLKAASVDWWKAIKFTLTEC